MRVWLDDVRPMPESFDVHVRTAGACIALLGTGLVRYLSFDHDLGDPSYGNNGYTVAVFIESGAHFGTILPLKWDVHSANPVGRQNILAAMMSADRLWAEKS